MDIHTFDAVFNGPAKTTPTDFTTLPELQAAMAWWKGNSPENQIALAIEHGYETFASGTDITRFWKKQFPKAASKLRPSALSRG